MLFARKSLAAIAGGLFFGLSLQAAHADAIADRQKAMESVGDSMKALAAMAKGEAEFDAAVAKSNAENIAMKFETARDLFPEGSETGEKETWAKAEIWQDKDTFNKILDDAIAATQPVAAAGSLDELRPALGGLGNNGCKACHEKFRRPKN